MENIHKSSKISFNISLSLIRFNEDDNIIVYSPALDLSGYGKTDSEAEESFKISLEEFIKYTLNKGTFTSELIKLGWNIRKKKTAVYEQPFLDDLLRNNKYLSNIVREKEFTRYNKEVIFPAIA